MAGRTSSHCAVAAAFWLLAIAYILATASASPYPRYPPGHPYYQEPREHRSNGAPMPAPNINSIQDLAPQHARRAMQDVTATISEVQKILATNPHLPRLTRGEIEELFENVTREEYERSMRRGDASRAKHMRALMVVLPYNTNNYSDDSLQELYTRPPVTRVVSDANVNRIVRPQQIVVPQSPPASIAAETTDRNGNPNAAGRVATTYKPLLTPTTFHPPKALASLMTRLPVYSQPQALRAPQPTRAPAQTTTSTTTTGTPTTTTSTSTTVRPTVQQSQPLRSHFSTPQQAFPQPLTMRHNVKDLLATIGLTAEVTTARPTTALTPEMRDLLRSFGLLTNEQPSDAFDFDALAPHLAAAPAPAAPTYNFDPLQQHAAQDEFLPIAAPSYSYGGLDGGEALGVSDAGDFVTLESPAQDEPTLHTLREAALQQQQQLLPDFAPTSVTKNYRMHDAPEPAATDYYAFKPLPAQGDDLNGQLYAAGTSQQGVAPEMEAFLRSFGLLDNGAGGGVNRNKKSIDVVEAASTTATPTTTTTTTPSSTPVQRMERIPAVRVDFLSPQLLSVLGNIGIENDAKRSVAEPLVSRVEVQPPAVPTVLATRRSDVDVADEKEVYSIETNEKGVKMPPATKATLNTEAPTKRYPVFRQRGASAERTSSSSEERRSSNPVRSTAATRTSPASTAKSDNPNIMIVLPTQNSADSPSTVDEASPIVAQLDDDYAKLQFLLATVKKLEQQNGTLSDTDLAQLDVNKLDLSETLMKYTRTTPAAALLDPVPLDPVRAVDREQTTSDARKNEVKRQSETDDQRSGGAATTEAPFRLKLDLSAAVAVTTTEETVTVVHAEPAAAAEADSAPAASNVPPVTTTTTTTTEKPTTTTTESELLSKEVERPNGLEDSFGGGLDQVVDEALPPPRRNGFYFFSDWNSFLEVGEDPEKVVVRFDPKIGDPTRFVKVSK